jgi:imidazole glycerol-phosphate synthase subunit HisF
MPLARRIIPCLDTDGSRVVKGVNFLALRDAGDPVALAARYNAEGADELVVLDIAASRDRRPTFLETIRRVAAELAIPLTAGGGIRSLEDARAVIQAGADKVTVNTAAVENPDLISQLSREFGAQAVVLAIDAKLIPVAPTQPNPTPPPNTDAASGGTTNRALAPHPALSPSSATDPHPDPLAQQAPAAPTDVVLSAPQTSAPYWNVMVRGGRDSANMDAIRWAQQGVARGAGEILLTSVDRDGTQLGFDVPLTAAISQAVSVPVIASGGAKLPEHFAQIFREGHADAALAASIFHDNLQPIRSLKQFLSTQSIEVRLPC